MKIEVLYPEVANLYGDLSNIDYLKKCLEESNEEVEIIETSLNEEPTFVSENVDLVYMGSMTESAQEKVIEKLKPYAEEIENLVFEEKVFLFTGNAIEIFGKFIENEDGSKIRAIGLYHFYAARDMMHRYSGYYLGKHNNIEVVGFKASFTKVFGNNDYCYFAETELGIGINESTKYAGTVDKNYMAVAVLGPILILNPLLTKELMKKMGVKEPKLAFEEDVMAAYEERLKKFKQMAEKKK